MSMDDWRMQLYVMLSFVPTRAHMHVYNLPPKEMFERGGPQWLRHGLQRYEDIAAKFETGASWYQVSGRAGLRSPGAR